MPRARFGSVFLLSFCHTHIGGGLISCSKIRVIEVSSYLWEAEVYVRLVTPMGYRPRRACSYLPETVQGPKDGSAGADTLFKVAVYDPRDVFLTSTFLPFQESARTEEGAKNSKLVVSLRSPFYKRRWSLEKGRPQIVTHEPVKA